MNFPKIISSSYVFVDQVIPQLGLELTEDDILLKDINKFWSNASVSAFKWNMPRAGNFQTALPLHILRPHIFSNSSRGLDELGNIRAQELLSLNRPIKFFWSGGIDSTLALTWLLVNLTNSDQLEVYHTCESIVENEDYIDFITSHNVKLVSWSDAWETLFQPIDLIVTATSVDQLTASVDESFYAQYSDWLQKPFADYFLSRGATVDKIDQMKTVMETSYGGEIKTTLEARWWFYYIVRHQFWMLRDWHLNLENGLGENVTCFYDTYEFDAWSQVNKNNFFGGTAWNTYKQLLKDITYKYWPNENFNKNKTKTTSIYLKGWMRRKNAQFDQQYLFMYYKDGEMRRYKPQYWPLIDMNIIRRDINGL
jgi:hypothetical protein